MNNHVWLIIGWFITLYSFRPLSLWESFRYPWSFVVSFENGKQSGSCCLNEQIYDIFSRGIHWVILQGEINVYLQVACCCYWLKDSILKCELAMLSMAPILRQCLALCSVSACQACQGLACMVCIMPGMGQYGTGVWHLNCLFQLKRWFRAHVNFTFKESDFVQPPVFLLDIKSLTQPYLTHCHPFSVGIYAMLDFYELGPG